MSPEDNERRLQALHDRAQEAQRALDDPAISAALEKVKSEALAQVMIAVGDDELRKARDTYLTAIAFEGKLKAEVLSYQNAKKAAERAQLRSYP